MSITNNENDIASILKKFDNDTIDRLLRLAKLEEDKAKKNAEKNPRFIQIRKEHLPAVAYLSAENGLATGIFMFLSEKMTLHNAVACSYTTLQEFFNASRSSVYRAVQLLKEKKFIETAKMGNVNVYYINEEIVWQTGSNNRRYAEFSATIVLSESEQNRNTNAKKQMKKLNVALSKNKENTEIE